MSQQRTTPSHPQNPAQHRRRTSPRHALARLAAALVALVVAATAVIAVRPAAANEILNETHNIDYTGGYTDLVAPPWATAMSVEAVGGSGGLSLCEAARGWGTTLRATVPLTGGQTVRVGVGQRGGHLTSSGGSHALARAWGGNGTHGGGAHIKIKGTVAGGGGGTTVDVDGTEVLVAGGGGGAGMCTRVAGGLGGSDNRGDPGHSQGLSKGGAGGGFGSQLNREGGWALEAGGGGGGYAGGGGGGQGENHVLTMGGGGGGGAGSSWSVVVPESIGVSEGRGGNGYVIVNFVE